MTASGSAPSSAAPFPPAPLLDRYFARLGRGQPWRWRGQVVESVGQTIESEGPLATVGESCEILDQQGRAHLAEVIGFRGSNVLCMPVETTDGIRFGDPVSALATGPVLEVSTGLIGRVLNALGEPIDSAPAPRTGRPPAALSLPLEGTVRSPLERAPIRVPLAPAFAPSTPCLPWAAASAWASSAAREWARAR
jgi:flagellum-specific ATP synthase